MILRFPRIAAFCIPQAKASAFDLQAGIIFISREKSAFIPPKHPTTKKPNLTWYCCLTSITSLGWTILVVYGLQFLRLKLKLFYPIMILVILIFCGRSFLRNRDWNSRESLIRSGLKTLPQNAKMHYNFANFLRDSGNLETAAAHYKEALRLWPTYASAHNNLGTLMNRPEDAEEHFLAAIRYSPNHVNAYYNLGQVYRKVNRTSDALRMLERCVSIDKNYIPAHLLMAKLHDLEGRKKMVGHILRQLAEMNPENPDLLAEYAGWLYNQGLKLKSVSYYKKALRCSASHKNSLLGMAKILRSQGQLPRVHQIAVRSHIMARAESGNQIFTGDLYYRSWQLQQQFLELSTTNTQYVENSFIESPQLKQIHMRMSENVNFSKENLGIKNKSSNQVLYLIRGKDMKIRDENPDTKCSATAKDDSATRITIIQGHFRLEPPYTFSGKNPISSSERENNILCLPKMVDRIIGEETEVPK